MASDMPDYKLHVVNDAAIAVGVAKIQVDVMPFDGYLAAIGSAGAGQENIKISTSDAQAPSTVPARDIAIDTDALTSQMNDPLLHTIGGLLTIINLKLGKNTIVYAEYEDGTGTAEGNVFLLYTKRPIGDGKRHVVIAEEDTAAAGSVIMDIPGNIPGIRTVSAAFIRGAGAMEMSLQWGPQGPISDIVGRSIAVDTDAEPINYFPVGIDIPPDVRCQAYNGFTGAFMTYLVLSE